MTPSFLIYNWLNTGSDPQVGVQLFNTYINPDPVVLGILEKDPAAHLHILKIALSAFMDKQVAGQPVNLVAGDHRELSQKLASLQAENEELAYINEELQEQNVELEDQVNSSQENSKKKTIGLREQFPFLADSDCPNELKILAADKITAYHKVIEYYNAIDECTTDDQLFSAVRNLVHWYKVNHKIKKEFVHYKNNKTVLGKHEIFVEYRDLEDLKKLSPLQLADLKAQTENNIRHLEKQIKKNDRSDLLIRREEKLRGYRMKLNAIIALLK